MNTQIDIKIKQAALTETEKRVAEYISKNFVSVCSISALKLGEIIGTSDTSVIRTARKLGFKGYHDMQVFIVNSMNDEITRRGGVNFLPPTARLDKKFDQINSDDLHERVLKKINDNINEIFEKNSAQTFEDACKIIFSSKTKFVMGFRGCAGVASLLGGCLQDVFGDVRTNTSADSSVVESALDITADDCLIMISYPRYSEMAYTVVEIAQKAKAKIIVMTDKLTAPICKLSDIALLSGVDSVTINNSYVAPNVIIEMLLATVHRNMGQEERKRLENIEHYISKTGLY